MEQEDFFLFRGIDYAMAAVLLPIYGKRG